jgi:5-(carboxyamino)imidazole ribonucleotide synthase
MVNGQMATLGVMGGGQLGRMFVQAAQAMGYFTAVLDPDASSPAGLVSHHHIQTDYLDEQGLAQLMQRCAAITTEFENVPAPALVTLGAHRPVAPASESVAIAQDRAAEKAHFVRCGVPVAPHALIGSPAQLAAVSAELLPGILKSARMGYDGKGQIRVKTREELTAAWDQLKNVPCVLEKMLPLVAECSVLVARGHNGQVVSYPPQRNVHVDGILAVTHAYAGCLPAELAERAEQATRAIAEQIGYVGLLCVEFFVVQGQQGLELVVNEMAPRPHNSGHHTIEACTTSQYEQHLRAILSLPLGQSTLIQPAVMINLLGAAGHDGPVFYRGLTEALQIPGVHVHIYGKPRTKPFRKMGHVTVTDSDLTVAQERARRVLELISVESC